jgi:lysophospholipase L1-like esterase
MVKVKGIIAVIFVLVFNLAAMAQKKQVTYLALGDSYTIGESVPASENFPNQLAQMMRDKGIGVEAPDIVAKTGWTTSELKAGIAAAKLRETYDYVTLLIGVNNQYRGLAPEDYAREFEQLLRMAIQFADGKASNVIVVSIPDWGATPFAKDRDRGKITEQITDLVAGDKLHPSGVEYNRWAKAILKEMGL